jgi:hypothetical protein
MSMGILPPPFGNRSDVGRGLSVTALRLAIWMARLLIGHAIRVWKRVRGSFLELITSYYVTLRLLEKQVLDKQSIP